jgi:hypothetical protein
MASALGMQQAAVSVATQRQAVAVATKAVVVAMTAVASLAMMGALVAMHLQTHTAMSVAVSVGTHPMVATTAVATMQEVTEAPLAVLHHNKSTPRPTRVVLVVVVVVVSAAAAVVVVVVVVVPRTEAGQSEVPPRTSTLVSTVFLLPLHLR